MLLGLGAAEDDADEVFAARRGGGGGGAARRGGGALRALPRDRSRRLGRGLQPGQLPAGRRAARRRRRRELARALKLDPGFVEAWFNLALPGGDARPCRRRRARTCERAVALDPAYADAVFNLATLEFEAGDAAAARRWWERYLELDRGSEWARQAERGCATSRCRRSSTRPADVTDFLFDGPEAAATTLLLAHGAGAPMDSAAMTAVAKALAGAGAAGGALRVRLHGGAAHRRPPAAAAGRERDAGVSSRRSTALGAPRAAGHRRQVDGRAGREHGRGRAARRRAGSRGCSASAIRSIRRGGRSSCARRISSGWRRRR